MHHSTLSLFLRHCVHLVNVDRLNVFKSLIRKYIQVSGQAGLSWYDPDHGFGLYSSSLSSFVTSLVCLQLYTIFSISVWDIVTHICRFSHKSSQFWEVQSILHVWYERSMWAPCRQWTETCSTMQSTFKLETTVSIFHRWPHSNQSEEFCFDIPKVVLFGSCQK